MLRKKLYDLNKTKKFRRKYGGIISLTTTLKKEKKVTVGADYETDHWLRVKKCGEDSGKMYLNYRQGVVPKTEGYPGACVEWEIRSMSGRVIEKNKIWCQKKDCMDVMQPEEMVKIVFGCSALLVYRKIGFPLFVCE